MQTSRIPRKAKFREIIKMFLNITKESRDLTNKVQSAHKRLATLNSVYPGQFHFPVEIGKSPHSYIRPSDLLLKQHYEALAQQLNYQGGQAKITLSEKLFVKTTKAANQKKILQSVLIGRSVIDIFIPNVRSFKDCGGRAMRGLAIEIDGRIHNFEKKMLKDESKNEQLLTLGIGMISILNEDLMRSQTQHLQQQLSSLTPLDTRERRRMWRRIYAYTLALNLSDEDFYEIFKRK